MAKDNGGSGGNGNPDKLDREITYFVDNEPYTTDQKELKVRTILETSGNVPAENFYVLEYRGKGQELRHDSLEELVKIHPNLKFAAVYRGETPVS